MGLVFSPVALLAIAARQLMPRVRKRPRLKQKIKEIENMGRYLNFDDLVIDKEFKELLPVLTPEEYEQLEQSILKYGLLDPIKIWVNPADGKSYIIDGHNRYTILKNNHIGWDYWKDFKYMNELQTRDDVKRWMLEQQLGRRNLSIDEKYEIVQKFKEVFKQRAKDNQSAGGKGLVNLPKVNTRAEMAKATGVSEKTYDKLDKVMQSDNTELKQKIHNKEMSIDKAYRILKSNDKKDTTPAKSPMQKIEEVDKRIEYIEKEKSALEVEKEALFKKRSALYNDLDIKSKVQYEIDDKCNVVFYVELDGKKKILLDTTIIFQDEPYNYELKGVPEKYKNDIRMLWTEARTVAIDKMTAKATRGNFKQQAYKQSDKDNEIKKAFYKKCFRILAQNFHPDNANGNIEDMQMLNQLKQSWEI